MSDYNGEQLAIEAADHLWEALCQMNLTDLDVTYRPGGQLASDRPGTPYAKTREALASLLTVIVSVDPWITPASDVAASIIEALAESGETPSYHIARLRRDVLGSDMTIEIDILGETHGHVYVRGILSPDGCSRMLINASWADGVLSTFGEDGVPEISGRSWLGLAKAIARHYRLSGTVRIEDESGSGGTTLYTVSYGD